ATTRTKCAGEAGARREGTEDPLLSRTRMKTRRGATPPFQTSAEGVRRPSRRTKRKDGRSAFVADVHQFVRRIPRGHVATYGHIAACLGHPRAARAVGWAMKHCPPGVPWHRVVNARGGISRRRNVGGMLTQ